MIFKHCHLVFMSQKVLRVLDHKFHIFPSPGRIEHIYTAEDDIYFLFSFQVVQAIDVLDSMRAFFHQILNQKNLTFLQISAQHPVEVVVLQ